MQALPTVKLENFEGPFDLLLELAQERRLDITVVSLRQLTDDFLAYVKSGAGTPELLGDFLVVAATLLLVKVRQLLPRLSPDEAQAVTSLTERLAAYQPFREAAEELRRLWGQGRLFGVAALASKPRQVSGRAPAVSGQWLAEALHNLVERLPRPASARAHLRPRGKSLAEWVKVIADRVARLEQLVFQHVVAGSARQDVAVSFLAVLELARKRQVSLHQAELHKDLIVRRP